MKPDPSGKTPIATTACHPEEFGSRLAANDAWVTHTSVVCSWALWASW